MNSTHWTSCLLPTLLTAACLAACSTEDGERGPLGGDGTITGVLDAREFNTVAAAYLIGMADDPVNTAVLYVFDAPIACAEIGDSGWDTTVAADSQSLEIKLIGHNASVYPVAANGRPVTGECDVNYTLTGPTPSEVSASSGMVSLSEIDFAEGATGTFDLTFAGGTVTGSFNAILCPGGREP